jgi:shikimate kinase
MKIVLLGYMASGKSAIGKALAKTNATQIIDLDSFIEQKEQESISDIFENKGEIYFRKKEAMYLKELLNSKSDCIVSVGGGTPCYGNNMELITSKATSFYLNASTQTIFERLKNETSQRPLVATLGTEKLAEYVAKHLFERTAFYKRATHSVSVNDKSIAAIVQELKSLL